ncbi:MAG TPA: hydrogenase maturation protease [Bryobacteraceae bacterium]|nr:hydrogenase maturation protease [Bryobacteraceae bacterium]HZW93020.1 hydrogenase maturation protease [Candidatus Eremiobacteraceae bacterium]
MLILGCGNPDRADDAAGLLVAARLRELGIDAHARSGDMLALIDEWNSEQAVILVDAVVSGSARGAITTWDARRGALPADCFSCSTHALGVAEAVELARALGRLPRKLIVYGIEATNFEPGGSLSPEVATAVERLAQDLAATARLLNSA